MGINGFDIINLPISHMLWTLQMDGGAAAVAPVTNSPKSISPKPRRWQDLVIDFK